MALGPKINQRAQDVKLESRCSNEGIEFLRMDRGELIGYFLFARS